MKREDVYLPYGHAVGIFLLGVLHVSERSSQLLDVLFQLQLLLLAVVQLGHFLIQLALHTVELQEKHEDHHVSYPISLRRLMTGAGIKGLFYKAGFTHLDRFDQILVSL